MKLLQGTILSAALGLALLVPGTASAQISTPGAVTALKEAGAQATDVQFRGGGARGNRGWQGNRGGWRGNRGWRGDRGWNRGGGIGLGIAAGAIIGGAIAAQRGPVYGGPVYGAPVYDGDADAYCASRFRSYDPESGTYLGYDGLRHACP